MSLTASHEAQILHNPCVANYRGAVWHRWEPHIHAPGTKRNDQFGSQDAWEHYLTRIEEATPCIRVLGITDYYDLSTYRQACQHKAEGRLPAVEMIFPNVEMRLDVATVKGGWNNIHLLINPTEPDHLDELERFLRRLTFSAHEDSFACCRADLVKLGKCADPTIREDHVALALGCEQFKVSFKQLRQEYRESSWAKRNILVAVAGGSGDGTSGTRESADQTIHSRFGEYGMASLSGRL